MILFQLHFFAFNLLGNNFKVEPIPFNGILFINKNIFVKIFMPILKLRVSWKFTLRGSPHEHNIQYFRCNICDTIFEIHTSNKFNTEILKNKREKKIGKWEVNCLWIVQSIQSAIYTYLSNATLFKTYVRTCVYYYWEKLLLHRTNICCSLKKYLKYCGTIFIGKILNILLVWLL